MQDSNCLAIGNENKVHVFQFYGVPIREDEDLWGLTVVMVAQQCVRLQMVEMAKFMLPVFYHSDKLLVQFWESVVLCPRRLQRPTASRPQIIAETPAGLSTEDPLRLPCRLSHPGPVVSARPGQAAVSQLREK